MNNKTDGQLEYDRRIDAARNRKQNAQLTLNNTALTVTGELCVGMTHSKTNRYYACTYTGIASARRFDDCRRWDQQGHSLDGQSDLDMTTIQTGIRTI